MALLLESLRNQILVPWWGRRDGLDSNEFEIGPKDLRCQVEDITTTAASTLSNFGFTNLACTVASSATYTLPLPPVGVTKTIVQTSSSTLGYNVRLPSGANFVTTSGSSWNQITFLGLGQTADIIAISSAKFSVRAGASASGLTASTF